MKSSFGCSFTNLLRVFSPIPKYRDASSIVSVYFSHQGKGMSFPTIISANPPVRKFALIQKIETSSCVNFQRTLCQPLVLYNQQFFFYRQTELHYLCLSWYMIFFPNSIFPQSNSSVFVTFLIMTIQKELLVYEKSFLYCTFYYFSIAFFISLIFLFLSMFSYSKKQSNNI